MSRRRAAAPTWTSWSRTVSSRPSAVLTPTDVGQVQHQVAEAARRRTTVKAVGAGHSFSSVAATDGVQLRLDALSGLRSIDRATGLVTVGGGTRLADLNPASWDALLPSAQPFVRHAFLSALEDSGSVGAGTGSPANRTRRRSGKSFCSMASNCAMRLSTEGTENHCVSRASRMKRARLWGSTLSSGGTRCNSAPAQSAP